MKTLILLIALAFSVQAQTPDWKLIKEMSGDIPNNPGLTVEFYAAEIARGDDRVKLLVKMQFPEGAPFDVFRNNVPLGFDVSSIHRIEAKIEFNCATLKVMPVHNSAYVYQYNGKRMKSKEPDFVIGSQDIWSQYFCERGEAPTQAPKLKT